MKNVYVKLVIAGSRTIDSIPEKHIVDVAVEVIEQGMDKGEEYITLDEIPEEYRAEVVARLEADGYDLE